METIKTPLNAGAREFKDHAEKLGRDVGGIVNDATDILKDYSAQQLDSAKVTLAHAKAAVSDSAKHYARITDGYVREYPWTALGVTAAAGLLISALLARR